MFSAVFVLLVFFDKTMYDFVVGDRIEKNGDIGTVKFIGAVPPTAGLFIQIFVIKLLLIYIGLVKLKVFQM